MYYFFSYPALRDPGGVSRLLALSFRAAPSIQRWRRGGAAMSTVQRFCTRAEGCRGITHTPSRIPSSSTCDIFLGGPKLLFSLKFDLFWPSRAGYRIAGIGGHGSSPLLQFNSVVSQLLVVPRPARCLPRICPTAFIFIAAGTARFG